MNLSNCMRHVRLKCMGFGKHMNNWNLHIIILSIYMFSFQDDDTKIITGGLTRVAVGSVYKPCYRISKGNVEI